MVLFEFFQGRNLVQIYTENAPDCTISKNFSKKKLLTPPPKSWLRPCPRLVLLLRVMHRHSY